VSPVGTGAPMYTSVSPHYQTQSFQTQPMVPKSQSMVHLSGSPTWGGRGQSFQTSMRGMSPGMSFPASFATMTPQQTSAVQARYSSLQAPRTHLAQPARSRALFTATRGAYIPTGTKGGCENQECAEEECDPEECGDENRAPNDEQLCGIDRRPLLPLTLSFTTVFGAILEIVVLGFSGFPLWLIIVLYVFWAILYGITIIAVAYCALCDPGMLRQEGGSLPRRAHKTWLYDRPLRRYDHYCRWLTNAIALLNHREFVILLVSLVTVGVVGSALDIVVIILMCVDTSAIWVIPLAALHLVYSIGLIVLTAPILRIHIGLISRNELAAEWKKNEFYVIEGHKTGQTTSVNDLSDDEFNELFDQFCYDSRKNPFDHGLTKNCWNFWCSPRWRADQLGEF